MVIFYMKRSSVFLGTGCMVLGLFNVKCVTLYFLAMLHSIEHANDLPKRYFSPALRHSCFMLRHLHLGKADLGDLTPSLHKPEINTSVKYPASATKVTRHHLALASHYSIN